MAEKDDILDQDDDEIIDVVAMDDNVMDDNVMDNQDQNIEKSKKCLQPSSNSRKKSNSSPIPIFSLSGKELSGSFTGSNERLDIPSTHQELGRVLSKDSFQEKRKLSKKYSTASSSSFGGLSLASSFSESPYINLISDDKDRRSSEINESLFKRKISEGPSAFIRMTSVDDHEIDTEFLLDNLEVNEEKNKEEQITDSITTTRNKLRPVKGSFKPPKPPRYRASLARQAAATRMGGQAAATRMGGSKVFENYEAEMKNKFGKDELKQDLYTVEESEKTITNTESGFKRDVVTTRRASAGFVSPEYLTVQPEGSSYSPFTRGGVARSTVCLSDIQNSREDNAGPSKRRPPPRSTSFRKSVQKLGGEFAKTWKSLTGK